MLLTQNNLFRSQLFMKLSVLQLGNFFFVQFNKIIILERRRVILGCFLPGSLWHWPSGHVASLATY